MTSSKPDRRQFLVSSFAGIAAASGGLTTGGGAISGFVIQPPQEAQEAVGAFPSQERSAVREVVLHSHFDFEAVKDLVEARPALAKACWDWGFGDWESALGAASHTGRREIAQLLLKHGARPTIFSAAMLGQLDVVRAFVESHPGIQRVHGPHGITLLDHAQAGGDHAKSVVEYLESIEGADAGYADVPLTDQQKARLTGTYRADGDQALAVDIIVMRTGLLGFQTPGGSARSLFHLGDWAFHPAGAPAVRVQFNVENPDAVLLTVNDPHPVFAGTRS